MEIKISGLRQDEIKLLLDEAGIAYPSPWSDSGALALLSEAVVSRVIYPKASSTLTITYRNNKKIGDKQKSVSLQVKTGECRGCNK